MVFWRSWSTPPLGNLVFRYWRRSLVMEPESINPWKGRKRKVFNFSLKVCFNLQSHHLWEDFNKWKWKWINKICFSYLHFSSLQLTHLPQEECMMSLKFFKIFLNRILILKSPGFFSTWSEVGREGGKQKQFFIFPCSELSWWGNQLQQNQIVRREEYKHKRTDNSEKCFLIPEAVKHSIAIPLTWQVMI